MDRQNKPDSKIVIIAITILIFSILCFGAVEVWSSVLLEASVFILALLWLISRRKEHFLTPSKEEKYMLAILLGFLAYTFIQMLPHSPAILKYLSPESFKLYSFYAVDKEPHMSVSLHPSKTHVEFLRMLTYSLFFFLLSFSIKDMATIQRMLKILSYFGFGLAVFAIIQKATWSGKIYWFREISAGSPFGPFVNRNHYAGLIGMLIPLGLGVVFTRRSRERKIFFGFLSLIMVVSLFLSLSRGGIISFFTGIAVFALLVSKDKFRAKKIWALGAFIFVLFLYLLYLGIDPIIDRFYKTDITTEERLVVWSATLKAFKDFYLTGSGLGTFINIFPLYSPEGILALYDHAHNDYLEFILEAGIIGTAFLLLFLVFFIRYMNKVRWEGHRGIIKISLISSITTMAVHSIFDFNLHIPSNALMLSAVFAMAVACSRIDNKQQAITSNE
ncbi:MAG: O-antigen ligase family protein [Nitrospirota bacterium]